MTGTKFDEFNTRLSSFLLYFYLPPFFHPLGWCSSSSCRASSRCWRSALFSLLSLASFFHLNGKYKVTIDYSHPTALESAPILFVCLSGKKSQSIPWVFQSAGHPPFNHPTRQGRWEWDECLSNLRKRKRRRREGGSISCFCCTELMANGWEYEPLCAALKLHPLMETDYFHNSLFPAMVCPVLACTPPPSLTFHHHPFPIAQWTCQHNNINGVPEYTWHAEEPGLGFRVYECAIRIGRSSVPQRIQERTTNDERRTIEITHICSHRQIYLSSGMFLFYHRFTLILILLSPSRSSHGRSKPASESNDMPSLP